jgi:hypothetical protein
MLSGDQQKPHHNSSGFLPNRGLAVDLHSLRLLILGKNRNFNRIFTKNCPKNLCVITVCVSLRQFS